MVTDESDNIIYRSPAVGIPESVYQGCKEPGVNHTAKLIGRELPIGEKFQIHSNHHRLGGRYEFTAEDTTPVVYFDDQKTPRTRHEGRVSI